MLTVLSGGTGTPKLLRGLAHLIPQEELSIVVNTGEDIEVSGLYVSPDLDSVVYTMLGVVNEEGWYGINGDTFSCHEMLKRLGHEEVLRIGDTDRGLKLYRTLRLLQGASLSEVTKEICQRLDVRSKILPMSDDRVSTVIETERGSIPFYEFWVVHRASVGVKDVRYLQSDKAAAAPGVIEMIEEAEGIVIGPSNPITSIGTILAIEEIRSALEKNKKKTLAVSPVLGDAPFSGPTGVLMEGLGHHVSPLGVAKIYRSVARKFLLDRRDKSFARKIKRLEVSTFLGDLIMSDSDSMVKLGREVLQCLNSI